MPLHRDQQGLDGPVELPATGSARVLLVLFGSFFAAAESVSVTVTGTVCESCVMCVSLGVMSVPVKLKFEKISDLSSARGIDRYHIWIVPPLA